ncbi:BTB/POZ and MATH domain-containing protein 2-like [Miscanthus floridulus]|uniref:BTB/POZ and MATH domain-containing protein 2-like n=1 Tax=Miscanthus floridulus TaxID=154761 RepID=UPI00345A8ED5
MAAAAAAKTASTLNAAFVHGTHLFDIARYSDLKALGRRDGVTSGTFRVAGRDWNVVCVFDGRLTDISLELAEKEDGDGYVDYQDSVTAMVSFSIDDPTGGRKPMKIGSRDEDEGTVFIFTHNSRSYTVDVPEAIHNKLEARYVKDGRLRIRCAFRVLKVESAPTRYCFVAAPPPPDITRFLRILLDSRQRADVTAKFFGDSTDSSLEWFRFHDVSAPVFRAMLHFICTDELPSADEEDGGEEAAAASMSMAQDLLVAADLYGLDRLRLIAISMLARVNGRDNCRELQDLCIGYVADDWEAAMVTEEYRELKTTCPALLSDVLEDVITKQLLHDRRPPSPSSGIAATTTPTETSASVYRPSEVWRGRHQVTVLGHYPSI